MKKLFCFFTIVGPNVTRKEMGLPDKWERVQKWFKKPFYFGYPVQHKASAKKSKYDGIDFKDKAPKEFWEKFPKRDLPKKPSTRIDIDKLTSAVETASDSLTVHQKKAAETTIKNLTEGAPSYQRKQLPGILAKNANSVIQHGPAFTETLEKWVVEKVIAGPFLSPPTKEFRSNSLMTVEQKDKVRPILNMSYPKDRSYNDNVDEDAVPKVHMSSARQFGQSVLAAGKGSFMSKLDMKDAYKHVPAKVEDYRLQGLQWMSCFFVDTQQIFGASTAVANFDNMASTVLDLTLSECEIPRKMIHRTLDDTACVAPADSGWTQEFTEKYKENCKKFNIKLAEDCPLQDKAFSTQTTGTILGIQFNTINQSWRISDQKSNEILTDIHTIIHSKHVSLKQVETTAGRLSNFGQMCPFLQAFKRPLNDLLASFNEDYDILKEVSEDLVKDLRVWAAVVTQANSWLPIAKEIENPPLGSLEFVSDAAGGLGGDDWMGVASLGLTATGGIWYMCRGEWPKTIIEEKDEKGCRFASKMTTLELVGLFLPILTVPKTIRGKNIILGVDNVSVVFGWENKSVSGDLTASSLIRALYLVSVFLECRIFVKHVPRLSTLASTMADNFTRASTATADAWATVAGATQYKEPEPLWEWLRDLRTDWNLGNVLIDWLKHKL